MLYLKKKINAKNHEKIKMLIKNYCIEIAFFLNTKFLVPPYFSPTLSFWIRRSWLGPKNLRFPQISTWCWQYWFRNKALRTAILYYGSTQIKWKRENKKQAHLITTSETCVWLLKTHFPEPHCLNISPSSTTYNVHVFLVIPLSSSVKWRWEY